MKRIKLHRVIYGEIIPPSLIALIVLTFVVFTREFGRLAELLIRKDADAVTVLNVVASLMPAILIFTVPFSFLIGTLVGFSRLSSDSEVVAMRASGFSVYQMLRPALKVGAVVTGLTLVLTCFLLPNGNWTLRQIRHQIGLRPVQSEIKPRVFNEDLPGMILYIEDQDLQTSVWKGVFLADTGTQGEQRIILSNRAYPVFGRDIQQLQVHFEKGVIYSVDPLVPEKDSLTHFDTLDFPISFPTGQTVDTGPKKPKDKMLSELWDDIDNEVGKSRRLSIIEIQRRVALPLSALIFAVLGVTLGVHTPRTGRGYGFVVGLTIAFTYYVLFATGSELAENQTLPLGWGVWGSNLLMGILAIFTTRQVEKTSSWLNVLSRTRASQWFRSFARNLLNLTSALGRRMLGHLEAVSARISGLRLRLARVIDLYVARSFLFFFLLTLTSCMSLFYLFTFFELIDDFFANNIPRSYLLDYFFYLAPYALMLLVPISMLVATLITFGVFDKTNQIMALKACGISIYRTSASVFLLASAIAGLVFGLQEYVLPYANQRQDSLRNLIKGRPVQTYYQGGSRWIFGGDNRLYHYNNFDPKKGVFAELSIYDLDIGHNDISEHIYARRAAWNAGPGNWTLRDGWQRSFEGQQVYFSRFLERDANIQEDPFYFTGEVKESSKMTYLELNDYIRGLQKGGFEVDHLRTELYKKFSFPIVNLVMPILGIPFALSIGRKGALYGIALGVLLGIIYWGAFAVFGVLGTSGFLSPMLAAWGPNLLFGGSGVLLLSGVKT